MQSLTLLGITRKCKRFRWSVFSTCGWYETSFTTAKPNSAHYTKKGWSEV